MLWNEAIRKGEVPGQWAEARVVLLWRKNGKTRPISLLSMVWRAGAKALARRLKPWCGSWASCFDAGGLPRMSASGALQQRVKVCGDPDCPARHCCIFDSIHLDVLETVLKHLHAPDLIPLLRSFYGTSQRVFILQGAYGQSWHTQKCGLAQGCSFSPFLAAALTHVWGAYVLSNVSGFGFFG